MRCCVCFSLHRGITASSTFDRGNSSVYTWVLGVAGLHMSTPIILSLAAIVKAIVDVAIYYVIIKCIK